MALSVGSNWNRWDVHIHTPGTALEDNYNCSFSDYIKHLNQKSKEKGVVALGITDYYSIDNYVKLKNDFDNGKLQNVKLVFPNIEFRLGIPAKKSKAINIHLLISPDDPDHIYKINNNLQRLHFNYQNTPFSCSPEDIKRLGSALDSSIIDTKKKYEHGLKNFRPEYKVFINWYDGDIWLKNNALIAISGNSSDGISVLSKEGGFEALRNEIESRVHIIFSANTNDIKYWLGQKNNDVLPENKNIKPCLTGSDAHSLEAIFESEMERYCWIKAEPTFEGFRQILYEPRERIFIGQKPPDFQRNNYVSNIRVPEKNWFPDHNIPINKGLVCIIGARGSGKTALLDLLSIGLNGYESGEASFIKKAEKLALPLKVHIEHNNAGRIKVVNFNNAQTVEIPNARYLSQQFVESLCSTNGASHKLVEEIEKYVFNELEDFEKQGTNNFSELKSKIIFNYDAEINKINAEILECSYEITRIHNLQGTIKIKNEEITKIEKEIQLIKIPEIKDDEKKNILKKQEEYTAKSHSINTKMTELAAKGQFLLDIINKIEQYNQELAERGKDLNIELKDFNLSQEEKALFYISYPKMVTDLLKTKVEALRKTFSKLSGDKTTLTEDTYYWYKSELEKIQRNLDSFSKTEKEFLELNKKLQEKRQKIVNIKKQVEEIKQLSIDYHQKKRIEKYKKTFELINNKCFSLSELYKPLENKLNTKYDEKIPLSLYVKRSVDLQSWVEEGEKIIGYTNKEKLQLYRDGKLYAVAKKILLESWQSGTPIEICTAMESFINKYITQDISKLLLEKSTPLDFAKWLFSTKHISTPYEIKYEDVSIEKLSPGTRGVVLMLLFLKVDIEDHRPLLIDQPEDNLDPASVFNILVPYFKEARKRRQIIMVTHNPNLVVGTDSDQVLIAKSSKNNAEQLPEFSYISGGMESPEIRDAVCKILEGGEPAFKKRAERYFKQNI